MLGIMVFLVGALVIAALSWRVFSDVRSHGFARFWVFVVLWALIVMNASAWFRDVLSARQLLSWLLLAGSLWLAFAGFLALRRVRGPAGPRRRPTQYTFEETTGLVTTGPYRFIRHPLYVSLLLLGWGAALKSAGFFSIMFALCTSGLIYITSYLEELENLERFGEAYDQYMGRTKMLIPGVL
jgi:protein-S-isoprenylcysteine O-methyltransferase Ste14